MNKAVLLFPLLIGIGTITRAKTLTKDDDVGGDFNQSSEEETKKENIYCSSVFRDVGGHCLFVDRSLSGTWEEMREICLDLGGDLTNLKDANFLTDINDYLLQNRLNDVTYWVGSNDRLTEGVWQWVNDNSQVKLGTPLWGDNADRMQQPTGGANEDCGILNEGDHFFMHDIGCDRSYYLICEQFNPPPFTTYTYSWFATKSKAADVRRSSDTSASSIYSTDSTGTGSTFIYSSTDTPSTAATTGTTQYVPVECPAPYEIIDGKCLFINTLAANTWDAHKTSCESLGGHMIKLNDANVLGAIFDRLIHAGINHNFWIGATDQQQEGYWFWHDGSDVHLGTPFWGDNGAGPQNPDGGVTKNCAIIAGDDHYFFHDEDCDSDYYVICQIDLF